MRTADGGTELIQPAELPQFGSKHAVILREAARIVSLHIDDMAVLNAHLLVIPGLVPLIRSSCTGCRKIVAGTSN